MKLLQNAASRKAVLGKRMLCIDPSSGGLDKHGGRSLAGWAMFYAGKLEASGTLSFSEDKAVFKRLRSVKEAVSTIPDTEDVSILVIEDIKGYRAQQSLIQSCGIYIDRIESEEFFQVNVQTWKSVAKYWGGYVKDDEQDAIYMGYAAVAIACGWRASKPKGVTAKEHEEDKQRIIAEAKAIVGAA